MSDRFWHWIAMHWWLFVCGALMTLLVLIHISSLRHKGLTTDEALHYQYGDRVLHGTAKRTGVIDGSVMPFSSVHVITSGTLAILARTFGISVDTSWMGDIKRGRYATIALSLLLAFYVLKWS